MKKSLIFIALVLMPMVSHAQSRFVPCDGVEVPCDFNMLMQLFSNAIGFLVEIALPLATITIIYAGFLYLTTPIADQKSKAKQMIINVVIGFAVLLAAFIIVRTIVTTLLRPEISNSIKL